MKRLTGANDGIIPMTGQKGGILNDADKEFLVKSADDICLAPTAREDAYTQRLYLYMMMNAPSDYLILSYSKMCSILSWQKMQTFLRLCLGPRKGFAGTSLSLSILRKPPVRF